MSLPPVTVSFVMPACNAGKYIDAAVGCVMGQTAGCWELVIVDDCSDDDTLQKALRFASNDDRIRVFHLDSRSGSPCLARRRAVELSRGELIAPLDADDEIEPGYLQTLLTDMARKKCDAVYPVMCRMDEDGMRHGRYLPAEGFDMERAYLGKELIRHTLDGWKIGTGGGLTDRILFMRSMEEADEPSLRGNVNADEYLTRVILGNSVRTGFSQARYFYRENPASATREVSFRYFGQLKVNSVLGRYVARLFDADSDEREKMEVRKFWCVIDAVRYSIRHRHVLTSAERKEAERLIEEAYSELDWQRLSKTGGWKYRLLFRLGLRPAVLFLSAADRLSGRGQK